MTLGGPKRFLLKNREKKFHISGVARKLENVSIVLSYGTIGVADTEVDTGVPVNDDHNVNNNFCDS